MCQQVTCLVNRSLSDIFTSGAIGAIGSTNGTTGAIGTNNGTFGAIGCRNCPGLFGRQLYQMATNGANGKITNDTVGRTPNVARVLPLEPMVPIVPTNGCQFCRQPRAWAKLPTRENDVIHDGVENVRVEIREIIT